MEIPKRARRLGSRFAAHPRWLAANLHALPPRADNAPTRMRLPFPIACVILPHVTGGPSIVKWSVQSNFDSASSPYRSCVGGFNEICSVNLSAACACIAHYFHSGPCCLERTRRRALRWHHVKRTNYSGVQSWTTHSGSGYWSCATSGTKGFSNPQTERSSAPRTSPDVEIRGSKGERVTVPRRHQ